MKPVKYLLGGMVLGFLAGIAGYASAAPVPKAVRDMAKKGWKLTFQDEFDGKKLDASRWIDSYPDNVRTHGNEEQQYYAPDGYDVQKGKLRLIARKREMEGKPYTSGIVTTFSKFAQKYGWYEIRARFPKGKGYWPAFWLLPDTKAWPPEIDVLEILGHEPEIVYMTGHWRDEQRQHQAFGGNFKGPDFTKDFHTFAVDWQPGLVVWYVDGVERFRSEKGVPSEPMYLLVNLAVGGSWPGNPGATTVFPGIMEVDYVRVFERAEGKP
ncbi:MAG: glycoside hydrolase family 16 protein [Armatimonadetes bacterium]|nr:glycoside hydrolase family 16 protein [Armatimonadota bacterium]